MSGKGIDRNEQALIFYFHVDIIVPGKISDGNMDNSLFF